MKKFLSESFRIVLALALVVVLAKLVVAADKKDARVTQVVKDVKVLVSKSGGRPAAVNETVREGQAVRTGEDSRAELSFSDQTLTRLGANTVFSFGGNAKDFDLASGAVLICVPKSAGTAHINTAAATAAVTGFTAMGEYHSKWGYKFIVLEGEACLKLVKRPNDPCLNLGAGDMVILPPGATQWSEKKHVDLKKIINSAKLINGFDNKLPDWVLQELVAAADAQGSSPPTGGYADPTGGDAVDQRNASDTPKPAMTPHGSPPGDLRSNQQHRPKPH